MSLENTYGVVVIANMILSVLFGVLTFQVVHYFGRFRNDPYWMRSLVALIWIISFTHLGLTTAIIYDFLIVHYYDPGFLSLNNWTLPTAVIGEPLTATIVQVYYGRRLALLNPRLKMVSYLIYITAMISFAFGLRTVGLMFTWKYLAQYVDSHWIPEVWLAAAITTDLLIVFPTVYTLATSKTQYSETNRVLHRLIKWTIHTTGLTTFFAFMHLVWLLVYPGNFIHFSWPLVLTSLYANTMLATLNRRHLYREMIHPSSHDERGGIQLSDISGKATGSRSMTTKSAPDTIGTRTIDISGVSHSGVNVVTNVYTSHDDGGSFVTVDAKSPHRHEV